MKRYRVLVQSATMCGSNMVPIGPYHPSFHDALMWASVNLSVCYSSRGDWYWCVGKYLYEDAVSEYDDFPYELEYN